MSDGRKHSILLTEKLNKYIKDEYQNAGIIALNEAIKNKKIKDVQDCLATPQVKSLLPLNNGNALVNSVLSTHIGITKILLNAGVSVNFQSLLTALIINDDETLDLLLSHYGFSLYPYPVEVDVLQDIVRDKDIEIQQKMYEFIDYKLKKGYGNNLIRVELHQIANILGYDKVENKLQQFQKNRELYIKQELKFWENRKKNKNNTNTNDDVECKCTIS